MASTVSKKRLRRAPARKPWKPTPRAVPLDEERMKQLMKQAVREVLEEREQQEATTLSQTSGGEQLQARADPLQGKSHEELRALALSARGSWKESEGSGTSVEIVRRLRDEWKHRPQ